jgi:glycine cleavage system H lipoate-binding protein
VNTDPHGSWLIVVRVSEPKEIAGLLDAAQYSSLVK